MNYHVSTIDAYIDAVDEDRREDLVTLIGMIKNADPSLDETLAFGMPTFGYGEKLLVAVAAQKHNFSLYVDPALVKTYAPLLGKVSTGLSCIRFKKLEKLNLEALEALLSDVVKV